LAVPQTDELLRDFDSEAQERMERLEELLLATQSAEPAAVREQVDGIRRELHTLKGNAGMMGLGELQSAAHAMEDLVEDLEPLRPRVERLLAALDQLRALLKEVREAGATDGTGPMAAVEAAGALGAAGSGGPPVAVAAAGAAGTEPGSGVRIPFATLDSLVDLLAEMVIARSRLAEALAHTRPLRRGGGEGRAAWSEADEAHERLNGVLDELQQRVLRLRMVPLGSLFRQLGRIVHDTAAQENSALSAVADQALEI